jgi:hypothetical protein
VTFEIATDQGTYVEDTAQLAVFLWGVNKNFQFVKELLELLHMKDGTGADQKFCQIMTLINKFDLRLEKLVGFVRNRALAMAGKNKGAAATLKK